MRNAVFVFLSHRSWVVDWTVVQCIQSECRRTSGRAARVDAAWAPRTSAAAVAICDAVPRSATAVIEAQHPNSAGQAHRPGFCGPDSIRLYLSLQVQAVGAVLNFRP